MTSCFWCCHNFDTIPVSLPKYYLDNVFHLYGNFCSYNCAAAYSFNMNDSKIWERYALLNLLYKKINNVSFKKIKLAPTKEVLKKFGGYMTIDEYRTNLIIQEKEINMLSYPIISIIPKIEEIINYGSYNIKKNKYIPVNQSLVNEAKKTLNLQRKKSHINNKNSLMSFMEVTFS